MARWGLAALLGAVCAIVVPLDCAQAAGNALDLASRHGDLTGAWRFCIDPDDRGIAGGWAASSFDDHAWQTLQVPGCWEEQGITMVPPGSQPHPIPGIQWTDYDGIAWYRLRFTIPKAWAKKRLILRLGSVDDEDQTFINGKAVGAIGPGVTQPVLRLRRYVVSAGLVRAGIVNVLAIRVVDRGGPGGLMGPRLSLAPEDMNVIGSKLPAPGRMLESRFANPDGANRILKIIHSWSDSSEDQDDLLAQLRAQGFGGVVCNVSFDQYLESEAKWKAFRRAVRRTHGLNMAMWLYDERGYPSGSAGGIVMRGHSEWAAAGLLASDATTSGDPVSVTVPPGRLRKAVALPVVNGEAQLSGAVDLTSRVSGGKLEWTPPPGTWRVLVITENALYEGTHSAVSLGDRLPYINLLMPEPTRKFLEVTHDRYARELGPNLGKWFSSTFTDEPSLMSLWMRPQPWLVVPWSPAMENEFLRRRGHELTPLVPALFTEAGAAGEKARCEFWQTVGELVSEGYFGQIRDWCRAHGLCSGGHLLLEESIQAHVPLYGDFFRCARMLDAPSIDCLTSLPPEVPWQSARLLSSVAELNQRPLTMCETSDHVQRYRPAGDTRPVRQVTEAEIRGTCNRLMVNGITTITSYYTWNAFSDADVNRLNTWVGRLSTLLSGGYQVADVAVLYPIESLWPKFTPAHNWVDGSGAAAKVETAFHEVSDGLWRSCRDFTYVDSKALEDAVVEPGGTLCHGSLRWKAVVLPGADTLPAAAWEKLAAFRKAGGVVISVGALPANTLDEFPSEQVTEAARSAFGGLTWPHMVGSRATGAAVFLPAQESGNIGAVVDTLVDRDVTPGGDASPVRATHRRIAGADVYCVINDSADKWSGSVRFRATGRREVWDPGTGKRKVAGTGASVALTLEPYGAAVVRVVLPVGSRTTGAAK